MRSFKRLNKQLILADAYRRDTVFASLLMTWKSLKKVYGVALKLSCTRDTEVG